MPVCTDIDMLKTIIRNLLSNAIKFSNENSEVLVKMEEQGDTVVVSVKDSGCGIDEEGQKKLLHTDTHFSTFGTNNEEVPDGIAAVSGFCSEEWRQVVVYIQERRGFDILFLHPVEEIKKRTIKQ